MHNTHTNSPLPELRRPQCNDPIFPFPPASQHPTPTNSVSKNQNQWEPVQPYRRRQISLSLALFVLVGPCQSWSSVSGPRDPTSNPPATAKPPSDLTTRRLAKNTTATTCQKMSRSGRAFIFVVLLHRLPLKQRHFFDNFNVVSIFYVSLKYTQIWSENPSLAAYFCYCAYMICAYMLCFGYCCF